MVKPNNYIGGKEASKILSVHQRTLYQWDKKGWIDTIRTDGGKRLYNVQKYLNNKDPKNNIIEENNKQLNLCYIRVSSLSQKDDLDRQKNVMKEKYPNHELIEDIGSGVNLNRRGFRKIIKYAIEGKIKELVVAYKDRLTRYGFELVEDLIKEYSKGKIIILNNHENIKKEEELVRDVLQIMNVFVAKVNGMRKYKCDFNYNNNIKDILSGLLKKQLKNICIKTKMPKIIFPTNKVYVNEIYKFLINKNKLELKNLLFELSKNNNIKNKQNIIKEIIKISIN